MDRQNFAGNVWGTLAGLIAYCLIGKLGLTLLQICWSDYALHSISKSYTLSMLLARQSVGIIASLAAGAAAAKMSKGNEATIRIVGLIVFLGGSYVHFLTKTWTEFPLWYHLMYVLLIMPVVNTARLWSQVYRRSKIQNTGTGIYTDQRDLFK